MGQTCMRASEWRIRAHTHYGIYMLGAQNACVLFFANGARAMLSLPCVGCWGWMEGDLARFTGMRAEIAANLAYWRKAWPSQWQGCTSDPQGFWCRNARVHV